jgi:O-antigen/teichoic acid export membrane protein
VAGQGVGGHSREMLEYLQRIYRRLTSGESTEEQAIQSGVWVAGINVGDRVLQLLKVVILARLLSPKAFGLLGIALLVIKGLRRFSNLGFDQALIQHQEENVDAYLNTAWLVKIARGLLIAAVAVFSAPYLAEFFNEPRAALLIQVIGVANLLLTLQNPAIVYFRKDLDFHKEFGYKMSARLADFGVAVGFAFVYRSVWALAAGIVAMNVVQFVLSYRILDYRPQFEFELGYAREMFGFGKWIFAQAFLSFLLVEADDGFVGWYFTASVLGYYQLAYRYSNAPATEITQVVRRVAFPSFSKIQDNPVKLRNGLFRTVNLTAAVSFPIAAGIFATSPQFVNVVLGEQWTPMIPIMQALALLGGMRSINELFSSIYKSQGVPEYVVYFLIMQVTIVAIGIFPAAESYGVLGVTYLLVVQSVIVGPLKAYIALSLVGGTVSQLLPLIFYPLIGSAIMSVVVIFTGGYLGFGLIEFVVLIIIGVVSYSTTMVIIEKRTGYTLVESFNDIRSAVS